MLTCDAIFGGKLLAYQEKSGYRFSLDAVLLAGLSGVKARDRVIDLGTGCGIIPLILAYRGLAGGRLVGVELQGELAALARKNTEANGLSDRIEIVQSDFRTISDRFAPETFDLAVSNPPYRQARTGRINPNRQRAIARHEVAGSAADVFAAGKHLLVQGGRLALIYPASRLDHLLSTARQHGFSAKRLVVIYSSQAGPARLVYLECRKGGGEELTIAHPFYIYEEDGSYTQAMQQLYEGSLG